MGLRKTQTIGGHKSHTGGKPHQIKKRRPRFNPKEPGMGKARRKHLTKNDKILRRFQNRQKALKLRKQKKGMN